MLRRGEPLGSVAVSGDGRLARWRSPGFTETGWIVLGDGSERGGTNFIDPISDNVVSKPASTRTTATKTGTGFIDPVND